MSLQSSIEILAPMGLKMSLDSLLPEGTRVYIPFLERSDFGQTLQFATQIRQQHLTPVPHLTVSSLKSREHLAETLKAYVAAGVDELLVVRGNHLSSGSSFRSTMELFETGLFETSGIQQVAVAGHPEGIKGVASEDLDQALRAKRMWAKETGVQLITITQFLFDLKPLTDWLEALRASGDLTPVHVGLAGPASVGSLIKFARACGVSTKVLVKGASRAAKAYLSPKGLVEELRLLAHEKPELGIEGIHFYCFGAIEETAAMVHRYL